MENVSFAAVKGYVFVGNAAYSWVAYVKPSQCTMLLHLVVYNIRNTSACLVPAGICILSYLQCHVVGIVLCQAVYLFRLCPCPCTKHKH